jgi:hypothetical protein
MVDIRSWCGDVQVVSEYFEMDVMHLEVLAVNDDGFVVLLERLHGGYDCRVRLLGADLEEIKLLANLPHTLISSVAFDRDRGLLYVNAKKFNDEPGPVLWIFNLTI